MLFTAAFWRRIGWSLLRTGLAALTPFIPALIADPVGAWSLAALTVGLALVLTVATALVSVPDPTASPWWEVAITRALRQFGQMVVAGTAGAVILTDVDWRAVLTAAAVSALTTLILAAIDAIPTSGTLPAQSPVSVSIGSTASAGATGPSNLAVAWGSDPPADDDPPRHAV